MRVLADPAWRWRDRLDDLLAEWCAVTTPSTSACLYLLADPAIDGDPAQLEAFVLDAAARAGADLDGCADINVLMEPMRADRDRRLHATVDAFVPLHRGSAGHIRLAQRAGDALIEPGRNELAALLGAVAETAPVAG